MAGSGRMRGRDERGTTTFWMLGLCLMLFFLGGISLDLWRAFGTRHTAGGEADAAAIAGASGIDEAYFRRTGEVRLDPDRAEALALENVSAQSDVDTYTRVHVEVDEAADQVIVTLSRTVDFTLLRLFGAGEFEVTVTARASPQRSL